MATEATTKFASGTVMEPTRSPDSQDLMEVTVMLDRDVVEKFKAAGANWRERMQAVLSTAQPQ